MPRRGFTQELIRTVGGQRVALTKDAVLSTLQGVEPGPIQEHAVEVDGVRFPVKEAFSRVTGLDIADFNTNQARTAFKRLGLRVLRVGEHR